MENIYQQAILDAKALRASAMANAKAALQEAFEPKIEQMVRLQLSEELEGSEEELEETKEEMEEGAMASGDYLEGGIEETEELDESELDEILAELETLSQDGAEDAEEELDEADMSYTYDEANIDEAEEEEEDTEEIEVSDDAEAGAEGEEETKEITVSLGDLKSVIDAIKGLAPELTSDDLGMDQDEADEEADEEEEEEMDETISLDEILAELENEGKEKHPMAEKKMHKGKEKELDEKKEMEKELEEAKETIQALQESMNEINLVNAKLLYMNKIFKAKSLTESQKIKVVKAFDRANSVKEVKNTYEVLKESVSAKKTQIQESFGYASKPAGVSPNANVIDSDPFVNRWQKLAGL
jgi:hypothetical protein